MKNYIGTKIIVAEPALRVDGVVHSIYDPVDADSCVEHGYRVRYADGYESWSPKDVFEAAYLPLIVNPNLPTDKPSISKEMVDDFIVAAETLTMGAKTTVVRAILRNGFEIVESSACVSKENYSEEMGREICMKKIEDKVWFLLGFLLQTAVHGVMPPASEGGTEANPRQNMTFGQALEAVKKGAKIARRSWNGKGQYVLLARDVEFVTDADLSAFNGEDVDVSDMLVIKTAQDVFQPGWLATQSDMLAEDWYIAN